MTLSCLIIKLMFSHPRKKTDQTLASAAVPKPASTGMLCHIRLKKSLLLLPSGQSAPYQGASLGIPTAWMKHHLRQKSPSYCPWPSLGMRADMEVRAAVSGKPLKRKAKEDCIFIIRLSCQQYSKNSSGVFFPVGGSRIKIRVKYRNQTFNCIINCPLQGQIKTKSCGPTANLSLYP